LILETSVQPGSWPAAVAPVVHRPDLLAIAKTFDSPVVLWHNSRPGLVGAAGCARSCSRIPKVEVRIRAGERSAFWGSAAPGVRTVLAAEMERRYRPLHPLEDGPDVRVYLVEDTVLQRRLVLRLLHPSYSEAANRRGTFRTIERRKNLAGGLIPILDVAWRAGRLGLVTERVTGDRLAEVVERCQTFEERCVLALRLTESLVAAHTNRLFYGCLKPARFFVDDQRILANLLLPEPLPAELPPASVRYTAPEVLDGEEPVERSDIYALGMLMYWIFTGQEPFLDHNPESLRRKQRLAYPIPPSQAHPSSPAWLDSLIFELVDKEPANRPGSVAAISARLEENLPRRWRRTPALTQRLVGRQDELAQVLRIIEKLEPESPSLVAVLQGRSGCGKTALLDLLRIGCGVWRKRCFVLPSGSAGRCTAGQLEDLRAITERPLIVIADDLQNLNLDACSLVETLTSSDGVLVLAASNPSHDSSVWARLRRRLCSRQALVEVPLRALEKRDLKQLLETSLAESVGEGIVEKMMEVSGGLPALAIEHLDWLRGTRRLVFQNGRWHWNSSCFDLSALPPSIESAGQQMIDRLQWRPLLVLAYLALLDGPAERGLLEGLLEQDSDAVASLIRDLEKAGLVATSGSLAEPQVCLVHRWLCSLIQSRIGQTRLAELNLRLARSLESKYEVDTDPSRLPEMIRHFAEGKDASKVARYLLACLEVLEKRGEFRRACTVIKSASAVGALPAEQEGVNRRVIEILLLSGAMSECLVLCRDLLAKNNMSAENRAFVLSSLARVWLARGQVGEAIRLCEEALSLCRSSECGFLTDLEADLLCCLVRKGNRESADKLAERLARRVKQLGAGVEQAANLPRALYLYYSHFHSRPAKAVSWLLKSIESALEKRKYDSYLRAVLNLQDHFVNAGDLGRAAKLADSVVGGAAHIGNQDILLEARVSQAAIRRKLGLHRQAVADLEQVLAEADGRVREAKAVVELNLELARNLDSLLRPMQALDCLDLARRQIEEGELISCSLSEKLVRAATFLILGKSQGALNLLANIPLVDANGSRFPLLSLRARANLGAGRLEAAFEDSILASQSIPGYMSHSRWQNRILQAEILLEQGDTDRTVVTVNRPPADLWRCPPLAAKTHLLRGRILGHQGDRSGARVQVLRALQILKHTESPVLELDAYNLLEAIGADRRTHYRSDCRLLVAGVISRLSPDIQESVMRRWPQLRRSVPSSQPAASNGRDFLVDLRELSGALAPATDAREAYALVLRLLDKTLHEYAPRMVFQTAETGSPEPSTEKGVHGSSTGAECGNRAVRIPVVVNGHCAAFVTLEQSGHRLSEDRLDFLTCVTAILGKHLEVCALTGSKPKPDTPHRFGEVAIVGRHPSIAQMIEDVHRVAPTEANVLLVGESGTGKELVAKAIHHLSRRRNAPFVPVDCSTLPEDLIENELFGHTRGSFTGALAFKQGLLEAAAGGTLFLDEIAGMPLPAQARLLRFLQDRHFRRLGETRERFADVRVVAATNRSPDELVAARQLRTDLYHRLNVHCIELPPLRDRGSDVEVLATHFLALLNEANGLRKSLSVDAVRAMMSYHFPGNVRELRNILENAYHLTEGTIIRSESILGRLKNGGSLPAPARIDLIVSNMSAGKADFWSSVREPFLNRDLSREEVRQIVEVGLRMAGGSYRKLVDYFQISQAEYKRFLGFLSHHDCKVDFREYRTKRGA